MSDFAGKDLTLGQVNALVKKLGGHTSVLAILSGEKKFQFIEGQAGYFDEGAYFQTRPGLWVDPDLQRFVGFTKKPARGIDSMSSYVLDRDTSEADIFGQPGSTKRAEVMVGAVDISQIAVLIDLQPGGITGKLLNDGRANLFAVIGKSGELYVVLVSWHAGYRKWSVFCYPWHERHVWYAGRQVFSNKS